MDVFVQINNNCIVHILMGRRMRIDRGAYRHNGVSGEKQLTALEKLTLSCLIRVSSANVKYHP